MNGDPPILAYERGRGSRLRGRLVLLAAGLALTAAAMLPTTARVAREWREERNDRRLDAVVAALSADVSFSVVGDLETRGNAFVDYAQKREHAILELARGDLERQRVASLVLNAVAQTAEVHRSMRVRENHPTPPPLALSDAARDELLTMLLDGVGRPWNGLVGSGAIGYALALLATPNSSREQDLVVAYRRAHPNERAEVVHVLCAWGPTTDAGRAIVAEVLDGGDEGETGKSYDIVLKAYRGWVREPWYGGDANRLAAAMLLLDHTDEAVQAEAMRWLPDKTPAVVPTLIVLPRLEARLRGDLAAVHGGGHVRVASSLIERDLRQVAAYGREAEHLLPLVDELAALPGPLGAVEVGGGERRSNPPR